MFRWRRLTVAVTLVLGAVTVNLALSPTPSRAAVASGVTDRVSVKDSSITQGGSDQGASPSYASQISADGTQVAFVSQSNLSSYANRCCAVFVRDLTSGRTVQISLGGTSQSAPGGAVRYVPNGQPPDGRQDFPSISADGRYVSFMTTGNNVVGGSEGTVTSIAVCDRDPNGNGVFDEVQTGVPGNLPAYFCYRVTSFSGPIGGNGWPHLSGDGRVITWARRLFTSGATTQDGVEAALLRDSNGAYGAPTQINTISNSLGDQPGSLDQPQISEDGAHIVARYRLTTTTTAGSGTISSTYAIIHARLVNGAENGANERVDYSDTAPGTFKGSTTTVVEQPTVSGDGAKVAFDGAAVGLDPVPQVYAVDTTQGATSRQAVRVSRPYQSGGATGDGYYSAISGNGRYVEFVTDMPNMHEGGTGALQANSCIRSQVSSNQVPASDRTPCQVVVRDIVQDAAREQQGLPYLAAQLASPSILTYCGGASGTVCAGQGDSGLAISITRDGSKVAYDSDANDLVTGDTNQTSEEKPARDVFVRRWDTSLIADDLDFGKVPVGGSSTKNFTLTAGGFGPQRIDTVAFSAAGNPDGFSVNAAGCAGRTLNAGESCSVTITFAPVLAVSSFGTVRVAHTTAGTGTTTDVVDSADPFSARTQVSGVGTAVVNPPPITTPPIVRTSVRDPNVQAALGGEQSQVSSNGNYDVFVSRANLAKPTDNQFQNVFVRDLRTNHTVQISLAGNFPVTLIPDPAVPITPSGGAPNGDSVEPTISGDGRIVSFVTAATNIVPTVDPGQDVTTTTVVCDRDPDGDSRFDEPQSDGAPDYRCFYVFSETQFNRLSTVSNPNLAADGNHLVYVKGRRAGDQANILSLSHPSGQSMVPGVSEPVPNLDPAFRDSTQSRPVVSNAGIGGNPNVVRVAFVANQGITGILATDMGAVPVTRRLDHVPGSATNFIGTNDVAQVDNPSITDDGTKVAFDYADAVDSGLAEVYLATVTGSSVATQRIGGGSTPPARGADPALSGDGRYLSYVTDAPNYGTPVAPPNPGPTSSPTGTGSGGSNATCLNYSSDYFDPVQDDSCQIVARDLVVDRQRAVAGLARAPDELVTVSGRTDCGASQLTLQGRCGGDATSLNPSVDRIGDQVGFDSWANDLVQGDTNTVQSDGTFVQGLDAFVRTFLPTVSTGPLTFSTVELGASSQQPLTLTLVGFGPYPLGTVTVGGSNGGDYSVGPGTCQVPGQILHQLETCTVSVTFTPSATGTRTGTVIVTSPRNPTDGQIPVSGQGTKTPPPPPPPPPPPVFVPQFAAAPNPVDFGKDLPLNTPGIRKNLTVRNGGTGPLAIESITVTDTSVPNARGDYTVDPNTCAAAIPAGGRCTVRITWIGRAVGQRPALVRFVDNASGGFHTIGLTATVPKPTVSSTPTVSSPGRVVLVSGRGFAPRRLVDITLAAAGTGASVKADARGRVSASMLIFPNITTGPGTIIAHTHNVNATITAKVPFLVMLGSLESPRLTMRH